MLIARLAVLSALHCFPRPCSADELVELEDQIPRANLTVAVTWDLFEEFSDRMQLIHGRLRMKFVWATAATAIADPTRIVDVANFVGGNSGRTDSPVVRVRRGNLSGLSGSSSSFTGAFAQKLNRLCYPFDTQTVDFDIVLAPPGVLAFKLELVCEPDQTTEIVHAGACEATRRCRQRIDTFAVGFHWEAFECSWGADTEVIHCTMAGQRDWTVVVFQYMAPSLIFTLMGFSSFVLPIHHAMPRVAVTMLALLSLNVLKEKIDAQFPLSGKFSWFEVTMITDITFMFVNLLGHFAALYFYNAGRLGVSRCINRASVAVMLPALSIIECASLWGRDCGGGWSGISASVCIVSGISLVAGFLWIACPQRMPSGRRDKEEGPQQAVGGGGDAAEETSV